MSRPWPVGQEGDTQAATPVDPVESVTLPAAQAMHVEMLVAPTVLLYVFSGQERHEEALKAAVVLL
jgi:hypothetical protein